MDLIRYALQRCGLAVQSRAFSDGEQAFHLLDEIDRGGLECPGLFLLDLNLPRRSGREVLQRIRRSPVCGHVPVIVFSSSSAEHDKKDASRLGADRYITKPSDLDEFLRIGELLESYLRKR